MDMHRLALELGNYAFFWVHTALIVFNLTGWAFDKTRPWQAATMLGVTISWFVPAALWGYPLGYCICTDWHWQIREALGLPMTTHSYLVLLFESITGVRVDGLVMDVLTAAGFVSAFVLSVTLNTRDFLVGRYKIRRPATNTSTMAPDGEPHAA